MNTKTNNNEPYIIHDKIMGLYIVMSDINGKSFRIAHFLTKDDAENFLS